MATPFDAPYKVRQRIPRTALVYSVPRELSAGARRVTTRTGVYVVDPDTGQWWTAAKWAARRG